MLTCVIAQPVHAVATRLLRAAGINVVQSPGDGLEALGRVIGHADAVLVRDRLPADLIDRAPTLRVIANHGTGTDKIDVAHATARGIPVVYTPAANVASVAEHALMLMLATARQANLADAASRSGQWSFRYDHPMHSLLGKTLGVVGLGRTGRLLCNMASQALNMQVLAWSPHAPPDAALPSGTRRVPTLDALLREADVVSLHRPLRADTHHTLNADTIKLMKPGAIIINTSRGGLIDEDALADALRSGHLFGAGLDVFQDEPLPAGSRVAALPQTILTPHVAGSTQEALEATATQCAEQILDVLSGRRPAHLVEPFRWEDRRLPLPHSLTMGPA